jgi:hypothetical protein
MQSPHTVAAMHSVDNKSSLARSWYGAVIKDFLRSDSATILGILASNCDAELLTTQRDAWLAQIAILRSHLSNLEGWVFFEFNIPRMGGAWM